MGFREEVLLKIKEITLALIRKIRFSARSFPRVFFGGVGAFILMSALGAILSCEVTIRFFIALIKNKWEGLKLSDEFDKRIITPYLRWWTKEARNV